MKEWRDEGIVLSMRPHGEHGGIVSLLTPDYGRYSAYVHGARSMKNRATLEPGSCVDARWQAKAEDQMGHFTLEMTKSPAAAVFGDRQKLLALQSACALADRTLAERELHAPVYHGLRALIDAFDAETDIWPALYIYWEMGLLRELGFGIDLSRCVVSGATEDLAYVSPKSGCAVSLHAAGIYKDKLLPIPQFLQGKSFAPDDIEQGLRLTGYFLQHRIFDSANLTLPEARQRLQDGFLSLKTA